MAYRIEFDVPGLPRMANSSGRKSTHWRVLKRETDIWKSRVFWSLRTQPKPPHPLKRAKLTLIRFSSVEPDRDGLVIGFKYTVDMLRTAGIIENDRFSNIGMPTYDWKHAPPKKGFIRVIVEEVVENSPTASGSNPGP